MDRLARKWRWSRLRRSCAKHLNPFVQYSELGGQVHATARGAAPSSLDPALESKLSMSLAELRLSVRAGNCLESEQILTRFATWYSLSEDELLEVRNFGETTLARSSRKARRAWACDLVCESASGLGRLV